MGGKGTLVYPRRSISASIACTICVVCNGASSRFGIVDLEILEGVSSALLSVALPSIMEAPVSEGQFG